MIRTFPEVLNFNQLFLELNGWVYLQLAAGSPRT